MKENWTYKKLGEVGQIITGSTPSTKDLLNYASNDVCFYKPSDLDSLKFTELEESEFQISKYAFEHSRQLPKDTVLTTCIGIIGKVGILKKNATCNQQINAIIPNTKITHPRYLGYAICSRRLEMNEYANAPVVPLLNKSQFSTIVIPIPPLEIQQVIVRELDTINDILSKKREQLKELDTLAHSIFYDMFGDPVTNEKGWEVKKLGEVGIVKIGPFGSLLHQSDYISGGIPLVNPVHMKDGKIVEDINFTISQGKANELAVYLMKTNDLIFARRGDIGRCAIVTERENGFLCGTGSLFVRLKNDVNVTYTLFLTQSISFKKILNDQAKGATMPNINCKIVENLLLPIPPLSLQQSFAEKIEKIEALKESLKASIRETETLLASRMSYWFE